MSSEPIPSLPRVVDQNCHLSLGAAQELVRGNADGEPVVFGDQRHMIVAWHDKPLHLAIDGGAGRKESQIATSW